MMIGENSDTNSIKQMKLKENYLKKLLKDKKIQKDKTNVRRRNKEQKK